MMAAEEGTVHHEDWEWDNQRENFTQYYKIDNRTLKDAAKSMSDNHDFHATPRQWERKVKAWGLEKYTSREKRLNQLEGRSIHEVARAGRRPKSYDSNTLHPEQHVDDRNIRRFARRELSRSGSRSRSRSRSNSFGKRSRSASPMPDGEPSEEVIREDIYDLDFSPLLQPGSMHTTTDPGTIQLSAVPTNLDSFNAQAHVMQIQDSVTGETSDEVFLSLREQGTMPNAMHGPTTLGHSQYNFSDLDRRYSLETMQAQQPDVDPPTQFPLLVDTGFDNDTNFMSSENNAIMEDISPTFQGSTSASWLSQPGSTHDTTAPPDFLSGTAPNPQSFHATPTSEVGVSQDFQNAVQGVNTPVLAVPELVFHHPASPTPSHLDTSALNSHGFMSHQNPQPGSHHDQQIYADFYAFVNRYTQAVTDAIVNSVPSPDERSDVLKKLANDLTLESKDSISNVYLRV